MLTKSLDQAKFQKVPYQINDDLLEEIQLQDPGVHEVEPTSINKGASWEATQRF